MSEYGKRRWNWAFKRSLERVRWDSAEGVAVSLALLIGPAALSWFFTNNLDLLPKSLWAVASIVVVIVALVGVNWLRAPAALDADRQREIDSLRAQLAKASPDRLLELEARLDAIEKDKLGPEQVQAMAASLGSTKAGIAITRAIDATDREALYRQTVATFETAGWAMFEGMSFKDVARPECGISLVVPPQADPEIVAAIRSALGAAKLKFAERQEAGTLRDLPQILFSTPYQAARWG